MLKYVSNNYLPVLVLTILFFDEIFHTLMLVSGTTEVNGIKQYGAIMLFVIVFSVFFSNIIRHKIDERCYRVLLFCGAILILYLITSFFYDGLHEGYISSLLLYGSVSIPAAYVGALFAKSSDIDRINKWLPFFVIPLTFFIGTIGLVVAMSGGNVGDETEDTGGLNRQSLSYYMAFSYTYSCFFVFYSNKKRTLINYGLKLICTISIVFSALVCAVTGGRGGFVALVVVSFFLLYFYIKETKVNIVKFVLLLFSILIVAIITISYFDVLETRGMSRIEEHLFDYSSREEHYANAYNAFLSAPWGNGLGSIFWINGIYSHNMILDLLAELGIIGTFFVLLMLWNLFMKLFHNNIEPVLRFMLLVFVVNIIHYLFSGYWLGAHKLFLVCSFAYCFKCHKSNTNILENENITYSK